ncbi:PolC-type DNA polymerase III [Bordetella genomosp. 13]|uniref:3'-5' exonuclease n=1 Tax=Bordetella genomosp. 13 TaxID=463040 RepID=UPI0011A7BFDB|nr:3'-5' exonuclease [Bordetella genomosp. 13]
MAYFRRRYSTPNPYAGAYADPYSSVASDPALAPARLPARPAPAARQATAALSALGGAFAVADLETTGLSTASCEILEFAAVRVGLDGGVEREYTQVVRVRSRVPPFISRLTGISQAEVDRHGIPMREAFGAFLDFVDDVPVFFHNASFDRRFLLAAAETTGMPFANPTHCTLALARKAWPELASHKLGVLAQHLGVSAPTHRALADVHTTVAVALAARTRLGTV